MTIVPPHLSHFGKRRQYLHQSVQYGLAGQMLDVWRAKATPDGAPVVIFVPGGAWVSGTRLTMQGHALLSQLVEQGWICFVIDYRTAPLHCWPVPLEDVRFAISWIHTHSHEFGGGDFVAIVGASAGGHLALVSGLTEWISAVVSLYGSYDWQSRRTLWRHVFMFYLESVVVRRSQLTHPEIFRAASPMALIHSGAPPTMIVHGTKDSLISVKEARRFYDKMCSTSKSDVRYLEVAAGHAFDLVNAEQCKVAVQAVSTFLDETLSLTKVAA